MASKDFIYDLLDKLESDKTGYVLMTFNDSAEDVKGDIYFNFYNDDTPEITIRLLRELADKISLGPLRDGDKLDIDMKDEDEDDDQKD